MIVKVLLRVRVPLTGHKVRYKRYIGKGRQSRYPRQMEERKA